MFQYTFIRDFKVLEIDGVRTYAVMAKSHVFSEEPERGGIIRVDSFQQSCIMRSNGKVGSKGKSHDTLISSGTSEQGTLWG